jgi:hypothetical protein
MSNDNIPQPLRLYSTYSSTLSDNVYLTREESCPTVREQASELLRDTYIEIFEEQKRLTSTNEGDKDWWIKQFTDSAELLIQKFKDENKDIEVNRENQAQSITIGYKTNLFEFNPEEQKIIMVGRREECTIPFTPTRGCSRLHAVIYFIPELHKILVADMGSLTGIVTTKRSKGELSSSTPLNRKLLVFDYDESAILKCGDETIMISPKECVVCMNRPRNCELACGHYVTCNECATKLPNNKCCICRAPSQPIKLNMYAVNSNNV